MDILRKMKENLGQKHEKGGFYPSREKIGTIFPAIAVKFHVHGGTVFEIAGGSARSPPLVKGVGTKTLGKGRVNSHKVLASSF